MEYITQAWSQNTTFTLRKIGYRPLVGDKRSSFYPVLRENEAIVATCYFSNYFTFATGALRAKEMYADTNSIDTIKQMIERGKGYQDLTLLYGRCLALIIPEYGVGEGKAQLYFVKGISGSQISESEAKTIRIKVYQRIKEDISRLINKFIKTPTAQELDILNQIIKSLSLAFSKGILKIPDQSL